MKKIFLSLSLCICILGCTTPQQTATYNSLYTIEQTADNSYKAYVDLIIQGKISTNSLPQVAHIYNDLHGAIILANTINQAGTNYLVPANITMELTELVNLISTSTNQGKK